MKYLKIILLGILVGLALVPITYIEIFSIDSNTYFESVAPNILIAISISSVLFTEYMISACYLILRAGQVETKNKSLKKLTKDTVLSIIEFFALLIIGELILECVNNSLISYMHINIQYFDSVEGLIIANLIALLAMCVLAYMISTAITTRKLNKELKAKKMG